MEKAPVLPKDIDWHFIGTLQTNKCKQLAQRIPNLWAVESMDTIKKAAELEKGRAALIASSPEVPKLRVFVQVNTSGKTSSDDSHHTCDLRGIQARKTNLVVNQVKPLRSADMLLRNAPI